MVCVNLMSRLRELLGFGVPRGQVAAFLWLKPREIDHMKILPENGRLYPEMVRLGLPAVPGDGAGWTATICGGDVPFSVGLSTRAVG
jgi:hypothetical protein